MGVQTSIPNLGSSKDGYIYIQLEKKTYSIGETITGVVCIDLKNYLNASTLFLKLRGRENVFISIPTVKEVKEGDQIRQETTYKLAKDRKNTINFKPVLHSWNSISPGQYSIPFSFLIPYTLPGSFYAKGRDFQADISYFVTAELMTADKTHDKLKFTEKVNIKAPIARPYGTKTTESSFNVKTCCKTKGVVQLLGSIEKDILSGGEKTSLIVDINNEQSDLDITAINCTLVQVVDFKVKEHNIRKEVASLSLTSGSVLRGNKAQQYFQIAIPTCQEGNVHEFKGKDDYSIAYALSSASSPANASILTTSSKLIQTSHYIRITCQMNKCCSTVPQIYVPIEIVSEEMRENFASAPPQWDPQVLESVNLVASPESGENYSESTISQNMGDGVMGYYQDAHSKKNQ